MLSLSIGGSSTLVRAPLSREDPVHPLLYEFLASSPRLPMTSQMNWPTRFRHVPGEHPMQHATLAS